jgi:hypothetical protein
VGVTGEMLTTSAQTIFWTKPDLLEEQWEFFHHPEKQDFYQRHDIGWDQILSAFDQGYLKSYPRSELLDGIPVALSYHRYEDYAKYLAKAKRGYRLNYSKMEDELHRLGTLTLPAPIILQCGREALMFSGYRRLCLAWNHGMAPYVWLVTIT